MMDEQRNHALGSATVTNNTISQISFSTGLVPANGYVWRIEAVEWNVDLTACAPAAGAQWAWAWWFQASSNTANEYKPSNYPNFLGGQSVGGLTSAATAVSVAVPRSGRWEPSREIIVAKDILYLACRNVALNGSAVFTFDVEYSIMRMAELDILRILQA